MNITDLITGGFIGSVITLIIKYFMDMWSANTAYKRELRKQVFLRKIDVVEKAMSWYQTTIDMYSLLQMAIKEYDGSANPVTIEKIQYAGIQLRASLQETTTKLNTIYLYYDFTDIEKKYKVAESAQVVNDAFVLIGEIQQHIPSSPITNEKELEIDRLWFCKLKRNLDLIASAIDNHKYAIVEIQQRLRTEYQKYMK